MPQMAPLNWLLLYFFFILAFLCFNAMNYYLFNYKIKTYISHKKLFKINWKW